MTKTTLRERFEKFGEIYTLPKKSYMMSVFGITRPTGFRMDARCDTETLWSFLESEIAQAREEQREEDARIAYGIKRVCPFCKGSFHNKDHYTENGVFFCIPKRDEKSPNGLPNINISGSEEDDGFNAACDEIASHIRSNKDKK